MNETLRDGLILTYRVALCACLGCWRVWRRRLDSIRPAYMPAVDWHVRIGCCITVLGGLLVSLKIQPDDVTPKQFRILFVIAVATMLQMALVALVLAPVAMRFAPGASLRRGFNRFRKSCIYFQCLYRGSEYSPICMNMDVRPNRDPLGDPGIPIRPMRDVPFGPNRDLYVLLPMGQLLDKTRLDCATFNGVPCCFGFGFA